MLEYQIRPQMSKLEMLRKAGNLGWKDTFRLRLEEESLIKRTFYFCFDHNPSGLKASGRPQRVH